MPESPRAYFLTCCGVFPFAKETCANFYLTAHMEPFVVNSSQRFRQQLARSCSGKGVRSAGEARAVFVYITREGDIPLVEAVITFSFTIIARLLFCLTKIH